MTQMFSDGYISDPSRTTAEAKQALEDQRDVIVEGPGQAAETTLTISSGTVTPTGAQHAIETEAAAATDILTNIAQTNHPDGRWLLVRAANAAHDVTLVHSAGGTGQMSLAGGVDCVLNNTEIFVLFRRLGTIWQEIMRSSSGAGLTGVQTFAVSGTWTRPAGVSRVIVEVVGGGGGGGGAAATVGGQSGAGGGGGAGGYTTRLITLGTIASAAITVGAAGTGVAGAGGNGGASAWNDGTNVLQGNGGGGGQFGAQVTVDSVSAAGGAGGTATGGHWNFAGSPGHYGIGFISGSGIGGHGGASRLGANGAGGLSAIGGNAGGNSGSGGGGAGSGASAAARAGGQGGAGFVIAWEYGS